MPQVKYERLEYGEPQIDPRVLVRSPKLHQIPARELEIDPSGRPFMAYHEKSDQAFQLTDTQFYKLFPDMVGKRHYSAEELLKRAEKHLGELDEEDEGAAVEDSIFSLMDTGIAQVAVA